MHMYCVIFAAIEKILNCLNHVWNINDIEASRLLFLPKKRYKIVASFFAFFTHKNSFRLCLDQFVDLRRLNSVL